MGDDQKMAETQRPVRTRPAAHLLLVAADGENRRMQGDLILEADILVFSGQLAEPADVHAAVEMFHGISCLLVVGCWAVGAL